MKLHFKIDLYNFDDPSLTGEHEVNFINITNQVDWEMSYSDILNLYINNSSRELEIEDESFVTHFDELSTNGRYIEFDGELDSNYELLTYFIENNIVEVLPNANETLLYLYTQNSENNALEKDITLVNIIAGKFNHSIGVKSLNVDVVNIDMNFNYVYIPSLHRYYYVDSVEIVSNDVRRLMLKEDVLMSWKTLIRSQQGFISRSEKLSNDFYLKDDRLPLEDKITCTYYKSLVHGNLKNVTLNYDLTYGTNFMVTSITSVSTNANIDVNPPLNSSLPIISSHLTEHDCVRFATKSTIAKLLTACYNDSASASYINSVLWLPFDPISVFGASTSNTTTIYAGDKYLNNTSQFVSLSSTDAPAPCYYTWVGTSPYLVIADFVFGTSGGINISDTYLERDSYWEIYIPFVGWVNIELEKVYGNRILVYYSLDFKTGISTAYIYNWSKQFVVYSTTCTLGIQIDVSTTNRLENTRQKQANDLNMMMSTLTSVMSIGVGVATENPIAAVGGMLTLGKAVASYVNNNNMLFERANTSFGTSDGALHSPLNVIVRRSYHAPLTINTTIYKHTQGYPTNKYDYFSAYQNGYVEVGEIHFDPKNEVVYQDEINEIVSLLKDGVIM